jgi:hypothetical protein
MDLVLELKYIIHYKLFIILKAFWEYLLEARVKLQNVLNVVNQFPQHDNYERIIASLKPDLKNNTLEVLNESKLI